MHGVGRTGVELCQTQAEVPRDVAFAVDEQGANPDYLGRRSHPAQGIDSKGTTQASTLAGQIHAKTGEDHHRLVVAARALRQPLRSGRRGD